MLDFNKIVQRLWTKWWKILFKDDIFEMIDPEKKKIYINKLNKYLYKFSKLVKQEVIQSNWVPGILSYLEKQSESKTFFVITATPQEEIEEIINALEIKKYFEEIIGAPIKKTFAVKEVLDKYLIDVDNAVMVGDSSTDYDAAIMNNIKFILRKTKLNQRLQKKLQCKMITDFNNG